MCNLRKVHQKIAAILFLSVIPTILLFYKLEPHLAVIEKQDIAGSIHTFSQKVKAKELTYEEIASKLETSAIGQRRLIRLGS